MRDRAHRPPATFPARRGMRAFWFRGRPRQEPEVPPENEEQTPPDDAVADPPPAPAVSPVRPPFGHPTF